MKKIILFLALLFLLPLSFAQEHAFLVSFSYEKSSDSFSFTSAKIIEAEEIGFEKGSEEGYFLKLFNENESYEIKFQPYDVLYIDLPSEQLFDENGEQIYFPTVEETIKVEEVTQHTILLPYMDNAIFEIKNEKNELKLKIDLQKEVNKQFPELPQETEGDETFEEKMQVNNLMLFGIGILLLLLITYFFVRKSHKKKK